MILPDAHIPHHDPAAMACVLTAHEALRPARTVILGDWLDAEAFSSHPISSLAEERAGTFFESEISPCRDILTQLEAHTDSVVYLEGNHEFRVERTVARMGGVLRDLADLVSPRKLLSEGRTKPFTYVPYMPGLSHYAISNNKSAVHGWTWCRHAASKHLEMARNRSIVHGHTHRKQSDTVRDPITGQIYEASSPGCLAKLQPLYMANNPTGWVHGFEMCWVTDDLERWTSYSPIIDRGQCVLPDGRKIDGIKERVL